MSDETIMDYPKVLINVKPSKMLPSEVGVFAARDLEIGTIVGRADYMDESLFFAWDDYKKLDDETKEAVDAYCLGTKDGFDAPADLNYLSMPWFFNHSCSPNVGFDEKGNFVVITFVPKGEEMSYDYGYGETNPAFRMECGCGSPECRKVITGNDWKDPEFRAKHKDHFMPELREDFV